MSNRVSLRGFIVLLFCSTACAQVMSLGAASSSGTFSNPFQQVQTTLLDRDLWLINGLVPPPPSSDAEKQWARENRAIPY